MQNILKLKDHELMKENHGFGSEITRRVMIVFINGFVRLHPNMK
jgi:hypothetical protein